jgi:hypothetical protein
MQQLMIAPFQGSGTTFGSQFALSPQFPSPAFQVDWECRDGKRAAATMIGSTR